ncbi:MAG TPA: neuraminidase-like domain-containing protein, partial [Bryobacteraceae bacterium]
GLEHCGSYTYSRRNATTGEPTDVLVLLARTSTEPYTFYYREVDRVSACAAAATALDWGPWLKIDLTIKAKWVTPVFAYERLFVFWIEQEETRSSQISGSASSAQAVTNVTVKYSFPSGEDRWVQPQILVSNDAIWVNPNSGYAPAQNPVVAGRFQPQWLAWNQPYVLKVARGLVGQGLLTISKNFNVAGGFNTDVERQVREGDSIWCAGEIREVAAVFPDQQLVMKTNWSVTAQKAPYKIIPRDTARTQFDPFTGPGTASMFKQIPEITGVGTAFLSDISAGDRIQVSGRIYGVVSVDSNTKVMVDENMPATASGLSYVVIPATEGEERLLVFFGAPLSISNGVDPGTRPPSPVGGADAFQQSVLQFNNLVFDSLSMTSSGSNQQIPGYATLSIATWLDPDLLSKTANLLIADYTWLPIPGQAPVPQPYQALVDASLDLVKVVAAASVIADNAWTNRTGLTPPALEPNAAANGLDLLYHISPATSSLLNVGNQVGWYVYNNGDEAFSFQTDEANVGKISDQTFVIAFPLAAENVRGEPDVLSCGPYTDSATLFPNTKFTTNRLTTRAVAFLSQRLFAGGVSSLLTLESQYTRELPFRRFYALPDSGPPNGLNPTHLPPDLMDFYGSYGLYFWEVFFFGPFLVADRLTANQRFDEARLWYQYIFNPTQPPEPDEIKPSDRYWRFRPFRDMTLESIFSILTNCVQIERYNNDPFNPDAIARLRPTAYAKSVVLRYIDNLLKWGDSLFSQDTRESINMATQLYVTASDLLGPRPASLGKCVPPPPASFAEIKAHYPDGIPQFLIDLENTPVMQQDGCCMVVDDPGLDIHSYFCIPENDDLTRYWDLVEDRLFKIRHCMNIKGIERDLALFSPPIDPRRLIQASAAGQSGGVPVTGSAQAPIPFYRFGVTLQTAQSFTAMVTGLGSALLSALEKNDAEQLALLRNTQELALLNLTTQIKQQQIEQTVQIGQSLDITRQSAAYRKAFYNGLISAGLLPSEVLNIAALTIANYLTLVASIMKTMSGLGHLVPNVGSPFAMTYGGVQVGSSLGAVGSYFEAIAGFQNFIANLSLTMAGYERREQDWKLQAQLADYDEQQAAAQILANNTQRLMAERELEVHYETIRQTQEVDNFYKTRFTNQELYQWMIGRISAVYFQSYSLAYDMSRSAQRAYQYELATDQEFVNFGYWDSLKKGLLAGEGLQLALSQMEKSYFDRNTRALEIEKTISLLQINPAALIDLKNKGECMFEFSEQLFDLDYPGQYLRKIKTVSISIPAVVGPYQNIKATLTQMNNQLVLTPDINAVKFLLGTGEPTPPPSLRSNIWTNQQIAISRGVNDSGMFELNFSDPRYLPFEGTGAVSGWKLSMPLATNRLNFAAITDVVVTLKYTAFYGGLDFQGKVQANVQKYTGGIMLSLAQTYSQQWYAFLQNHSDPATQTLDFELPPGFVPSFLKSPKLTGVFTQLELKSGVNADQTQPYIDFYAANGLDPIPLPVRSANGGFTDPFSPILLSDVVGPRKISFRLGQTPSSLLLNGFLNPAVLKNIGLILYIEGDVDWR